MQFASPMHRFCSYYQAFARHVMEVGREIRENSTGREYREWRESLSKAMEAIRPEEELFLDLKEG